MQQIRSKDTKPELVVRHILFRAGYRYRIHVKNLPGKPDIVLARFKKVVFVNGCFWHRHDNCIDASKPKTNQAFWEDKISKTVSRDKKNVQSLKDLGWDVRIIWECELKGSPENLNDIVLRKVFR